MSSGFGDDALTLLLLNPQDCLNLEFFLIMTFYVYLTYCIIVITKNTSTLTMHIFIDESGDLGLNFSSRSCSRYFVISALVCHNKISAGKISNAVKKTLKNKINTLKKKRVVHELKGRSTNLDIKRYFFAQIQKIDYWYLCSVTFNKADFLKSPNSHIDKDDLYDLLVYRLLKNINFSDIHAINLIIDKSKNLQGMKKFDHYIKSNLQSAFPCETSFSITHEDSIKNYGLQAVDMFSYGILAKYEKNDLSWYQLFEGYIRFEKKLRIK